jgi:hypothetical protein
MNSPVKSLPKSLWEVIARAGKLVPLIQSMILFRSPFDEIGENASKADAVDCRRAPFVVAFGT